MFRYLVKLQPHLAATSPEWWWVDKLSRCDSRLIHHYYYYWYITITMDILLLLLLVNYRISPLLSILLVKFATNFEFRKKAYPDEASIQVSYHHLPQEWCWFLSIFRMSTWWTNSSKNHLSPYIYIHIYVYIHIYIYMYIYIHIYIYIHMYTYLSILSYLILSYLIYSSSETKWTEPKFFRTTSPARWWTWHWQRTMRSPGRCGDGDLGPFKKGELTHRKWRKPMKNTRTWGI